MTITPLIGVVITIVLLTTLSYVWLHQYMGRRDFAGNVFALFLLGLLSTLVVLLAATYLFEI